MTWNWSAVTRRWIHCSEPTWIAHTSRVDTTSIAAARAVVGFTSARRTRRVNLSYRPLAILAFNIEKAVTVQCHIGLCQRFLNGSVVRLENSGSAVFEMNLNRSGCCPCHVVTQLHTHAIRHRANKTESMFKIPGDCFGPFGKIFSNFKRGKLSNREITLDIPQ